FEELGSVAVTRAVVDAQIAALFDVAHDPGLAPMQGALALFDSPKVAAQPLPPFVEYERAIVAARRPEGTPATQVDVVVQRAGQADADSFGAFHARHGAAESFVKMPLEVQREYLALWARSAFCAKRRFYRSAKAIVVVSTYSLPAMWAAIG